MFKIDIRVIEVTDKREEIVFDSMRLSLYEGASRAFAKGKYEEIKNFAKKQTEE